MCLPTGNCNTKCVCVQCSGGLQGPGEEPGQGGEAASGAAGENTTQHMPHNPVSLLVELPWLPGI